MQSQLDNPVALIKSWSLELEARINRVRNLIGDAHWPTEGRYKEKIITDFVASRLPQRFSVEGGFVISPFVKDSRSREIDILVADSWKEPFALSEFGTLITYPSAAVAQVQVKSSFGVPEIKDVIDALASARFANQTDIWSGGIFLAGSQMEVSTLMQRLQLILDYIASDAKEAIKRSPNTLCVLGGPFIIIKTSTADRHIIIKAIAFNSGDLSFGLFMANLFQHVFSITSNNNRLRLQELISSMGIQPVAIATKDVPL